MKSINGMAEQFRNLLETKDIFALPGCYDVLSASLLERAGFEAIFLSGYGVAASFLGNPDVGLTSLTETTSLARNVVSAVRTPVVVDIDNGYGNEENVRRAIFELEASGVAAVQLEDQVFPKRCGHSDQKEVVELDVYLKKLEYALKARQTPLCVIARTDSKDLDEAILRATRFHQEGADVTIIDGLSSLEAVERVGREVPGIKQINLIYGGKTPLLNLEEFRSRGFKIVLYSTPALYLATYSLAKWLKVLHETGDLNSISEHSCNFSEFQQFIEKGYQERFRDM